MTDSDGFVIVTSPNAPQRGAASSARLGASEGRASGAGDGHSAEAVPSSAPNDNDRRSRRERDVLRRAVAFAHHIGVQASAITELAYQIEGLRVDPLSTDTAGVGPSGDSGAALGFGGFSTLTP